MKRKTHSTILNNMEDNITIVPIPGACAAINSLICSGLDTRQFLFIGFLSTKTKDKKDKLFYPDWIIKFCNGKIGIFDTKLGTTLSTEGRARGLQEKIKLLGSNFIGGIVLKQNGVFYYCDDIDYNDISPQENNWKIFR